MELLFPILLVVLAVFMFLSVRRQKKMAAEIQEMQDSLQPGARVQTTSGTYATVVAVGDGVVDLELAPGVVTRWNRLAVREVVHPDDVATSFPGVDTSDYDDYDESDDHDDVDSRVELDKKAERDN
ncbi:preprotein translocase subunit YajC [Williamsia sp. CHRR-6]|uniref:preprotein translocase subunit YajC n=1 Tax=Williamsia sp. CHRR-6 TaxID=2835871 RepID=UPI001BDA85A7|nr:preprotein translocase subunit YajC [Williamsia sp. CHRR-6]MBT0567980.1 preprotein translocase subunit YajC [Williamsia sp. CHRR-6]